MIRLSEHSLEKQIDAIDSFIIYLCIKGNVEVIYPIGKENFKAGEAALIPAIMEDIIINPVGESEILEVYIA